MRSVKNTLVFATVGLLLILSHNACDANPRFIVVNNTSTAGNPMVANKLILGICSTINRCHPQVSFQQCNDGLMSTPGFNIPIGLSSGYSTMSEILSAEQLGVLVGNQPVANSCSDHISHLNCSEPQVQAAYDATKANPFEAAPQVIPTNICEDSFTPGIGLEVPIELVDFGLSSSTTPVKFARTQTTFNPNDYNGNVSVFFEIVATNIDSVPRQVALMDSNGNTAAVINVPNGLNMPTRIRANASATIANSIYQMQIEGTTNNNQLSVYTGRLLVQQTNATKTKIYVPLVGRYPDATSSADNASANTDYGGASFYTQAREHHESLWRKNNAAFRDIPSGNPWTFEVVLSAEDATSTAFASVFNASTDAQVTATEVSTTNVVPTLRAVDFSDSATNFSDLSNFEVRINNQGGSASLYRAGLWLKIENLAHAEIYYRHSLTIYQRSQSDYKPFWNIVLFDSTKFSLPFSVYHEATGYISSIGSPCTSELYGIGPNDAGSVGSTVANSQLSFSTPTRTLKRTPVSLIQDERYMLRVLANPGPGDCIIPQSRIVVGF